MDAGYILLVEDDPDHVALIRRALRQIGVTNPIRWMEDGEQALAYLGNDAACSSCRALPALMLLDLNLPRISGLMVLQQVRSHPRTQFLPVIVLSSSDEESDVAGAYQFGANSYISKPVDYLEFTAVMQSVTRYWLGLNRLPTVR